MSDLSESAAEWVSITDLKPWEQNPRNNDHAVADVASSIERFGFASPIIARLNGEVIAGHTRLKAAQSLGLDRVPVRYMDLDPADAKMLALADNKIGELADWNDDDLVAILRELNEEGAQLDGLGWGDDEISELLADPVVLDGTEDEAPDPPENAVSVPGEVYELGPHRLACGSSLEPGVWKAVLGDDLLQCVWTDPPYGVSYVGKTEEALTIENDSMSPEETAALWDGAFEAICGVSEPGCAWYASAPAGPLFWRIGRVLEGFGWKRTLVWVKDRFVMGRGDYHYRHEPIFHGWFDGAKRLNPVPRNVDTVFEFARPTSSRMHPTMKPVALVSAMLQNSSRHGWLVGDPFGGSGSTLIACATLGRRARVIEIDPRYCDVIRRRWTAFAETNGIDPGTGAL